MGIWTRIRQNLSLKIISLIAAVLLYMYVQQDRNPIVSRTLLANVEYRNRQSGYQVVPDTQSFTVTVVGPKPIVDRLKDGDIKAIADLGAVTAKDPDTRVHVSYELPRTAGDIMLDSPRDFIKVQLFRQKARKVKIEAIYKNVSPPGYGYGDPVIHPAMATIRGREDSVSRVDKVVAIASPVEPQLSVDGDFTLTAWDSDHNIVDGVVIEPEKAHIAIPQVLLPSEQIVEPEAVESDRIAPPYYLKDKKYIPNQVKVVGPPQRVAAIRRIYTETLSIHDLTETTTIDATLIIPPDVQVRDLNGKRITHVKVTYVIAKSNAEPVTPPQPAAPSTATKTDVPTGQ